MITVFVTHVVALKNCPAFKLSARISLWKLRTFLIAGLKDSTKVHCLTFAPGFGNYIPALPHPCLIPNPFVLQILPLFVEGCTSFRVLGDFIFGDKASYGCKQFQCVLELQFFDFLFHKFPELRPMHFNCGCCNFWHYRHGKLWGILWNDFPCITYKFGSGRQALSCLKRCGSGLLFALVAFGA